MQGTVSGTKPHAALYIGSLTLGGAEHVLVNLAEALFDRGWRVSIVTTYFADEEYEMPHALWRRAEGGGYSPDADGTTVQALTLTEEPVQAVLTDELIRGGSHGGESGSRAGIVRRFSGISSAETVGRLKAFRLRKRRLEEIWQELKPSVILSFIGKNNLMALITARRFGIPVVAAVRAKPEEEYESRAMLMAANLMFPRAAAVVLQTVAAAQYFAPAVRRKVVVMPNAVSSEFLTDVSESDEIPGRDKTIVAVGRLDDNKNMAMLLRAYARLRSEDNIKYQVLLYGDGESRQKLERLSSELGIDDAVTFCGRQSGIAEKIRGAGIYCLLSNREGMPNALIEAMCLGIPSITTDCICGGISQLVTDGEDALVIKPGDEDGLIAALRRLMSDEELRRKLSAGAGKLRARYEPGHVYDMWEELLLKCAE